MASSITWYACGQIMPNEKLGPELGETILERIKKTMPNLAPTTYEAANAYLQEEHKKPEGTRNLLREMCMMIPFNLPTDRKVYFKSDAMKQLIQLNSGDAILYPTTDLPPNSFGTWENLGYLDHELEKLVFDPQPHEPLQGLVLLTYLTKTGPDDVRGPSNVKQYQVDASFK